MPRIREFSQDDEHQFEKEVTQNEIDMEDSITLGKPKRNYSASRSSSPDCLTQTQSKSPGL
jgi:hypothetical protein